MKHGLYHHTLFSVSLEPDAFLWVTLTDVWIPETEVHTPVVFERGFPNVPDNNDFPQKAF